MKGRIMLTAAFVLLITLGNSCYAGELTVNRSGMDSGDRTATDSGDRTATDSGDRTATDSESINPKTSLETSGAPAGDRTATDSGDRTATDSGSINPKTGPETSGAPAGDRTEAIVAGHRDIIISRIPLKWIEKAKSELHIAFGHTSHGSQITEGLLELTNFKKSPYIYKRSLPKDSLDLRDNPFGGDMDLGNPDHKIWAEKTKNYLGKNEDINVVMWSWCGQLSNAGTEFVQNYLDLMQSLETQFPGVTFIYMTGHLDGTGENGTLARNNGMIRDFCIKNKKVLFDFADIESYDPDGAYYGDKYANDACDFDSNGDMIPDKNWALEWQEKHKRGVDWYQCNAAHSQPVNGNMKAYAMWSLLARLAGWNGESSEITDLNGTGDMSFEFYAEKLQEIGLFSGTDRGFELDRTPTRLEGAVMLTRLLGGEKEALGTAYTHPFTDAEKSWGSQYIGYLYNYKLASGISENRFGCDKKLDSSAYVTFLLRILGYSDKPGGDFSWAKSPDAAMNIGMIGPEYCAELKDSRFSRGHMAKLTCLCLGQKLKGSGITLMEKLKAVYETN